MLQGIGFDHPRLDRRVVSDQFREIFHVQGQCFSDLVLQAAESIGVADDVVLDALSQPVAQFRRREGFQSQRIGKHGDGLMKRSDQILPRRVIDARLAADAGIHHGQKSGWDLHKRHAAQHRRRDEPGHVADHSAAECQYRRAALDPRGKNAIEHRQQISQRFVLFSGWKNRHDRRDSRG